MSLSICSECQTIEGGWRGPTTEECEEYGIDPDSNELEVLVCDACGASGSYRGIPEHDDFDMER